MPRTPLLLARLRLRWHRRALTRWAVTVVCAGTGGFLLASARSSPGPVSNHSPAVRPVVVTTAPQGPASRLPPGSRGVTVPTGDSAPSLRVGDHVDLVITGNTPTDGSTWSPPGSAGPLGPEAGGAAPPTSSPSSPDGIAAGGVLVVDTRPDAITIAVPADRVPAVARAVGGGSVVVVLSGPVPAG